MPNAPRSTEVTSREVSRRSPRIPASSLQQTADVEAQPFLKWAGGKSQLLEQFEPFFPESVRSYCEPFLGGGAVFFHLKARFPKMRATLCDNNQELINCYQVVRDHVGELVTHLDEHLLEFRMHGEQHYYHVRKQHELKGAVQRAARMIFLNKTCYNGLWRVNGSGSFNVPIGSYRPERVSLYARSNMLAASRALQEVDLRVQDFCKTMTAAQPGDFLYIDPPYYPLSRTANFTSYTKKDFGPAEQQKLSELYAAADRHGAKLMLSNSDTPETRQFYAGFTLKTVQARRAVNCDGAKRGRISELVVLNYH